MVRPDVIGAISNGMNTQLKNKIMIRVYAVWFMQKATDSVYLKLAMPALALWLMSFYVSVSKVAENFPKKVDMGAYYNFVISAFSKTEAATLVLFAVALFSISWLARDSLKNVNFLRLKRAI